jgi:hypothetical protein
LSVEPFGSGTLYLSGFAGFAGFADALVREYRRCNKKIRKKHPSLPPFL